MNFPKVNFGAQLLILFILSYIFTFLQINFNPALGQIYQSMIVGVLIIWVYAIITKSPEDGLPLFATDPPKWGEIMLWGAGAFAVFVGGVYAASMAFPQFFGVTTQVTLGSTLGLIKGFVGATVLEKSVLIQYFSYGVLIPFIENILLAASVIYLFSIFSKTNVYDGNIFKSSVVVVVLLVAASAALFHLQAKGITNAKDLTISAIFFGLTALTIIKTKSVMPSIVMHGLNNFNALR